MKRKCFNCGETLSFNSLKCSKCGYMPDIDFMRRCPNLEVATCSLSGNLCSHLGNYHTCSLKNEADKDF